MHILYQAVHNCASIAVFPLWEYLMFLLTVIKQLQYIFFSVSKMTNSEIMSLFIVCYMYFFDSLSLWRWGRDTCTSSADSLLRFCLSGHDFRRYKLLANRDQSEHQPCSALYKPWSTVRQVTKKKDTTIFNCMYMYMHILKLTFTCMHIISIA